ncbi:MAG: mechanosensitive ion channel family protein [Rhodobacteraceae bacterium]|nr:mechanosensitive ion channel family protein [Paracoccaceae bacterium]
MHIYKQSGGTLVQLLTLLAMLALPLAAFAQQTDDSATNFQAADAADESDLTKDELRLLTLPMSEAELGKLAEVWQGHLQDSVKDNVLLELELRNATSGQASAIRKQIVVSATELNTTLEKYRTVLDQWKLKGASQDSLALHTKYASAVSAELFRVTDIRALFRIAKVWLLSSNGGLGFFIKIAAGIIALFVLSLIAKFNRRLARQALERVSAMSQLLKSFVQRAVYWLTLVLGFVLFLAIVGVNVTPVFAVFGGISFILAFALQDTLGNLASGLMIMLLKPFDTGDLIHVSGTSGVVDEMSIIATTIRTFDNQIIVVPNSKAWGDVITNVNAAPERRVDLVFGIGYADNAPKAIEILSTLIEKNNLCLSDPAPSIFVGELGDSSVNIFCRPWVKTPDYWTVYWALLHQAKEQFDAEGISIPFPQRDVHVYQMSDQTEG